MLTENDLDTINQAFIFAGFLHADNINQVNFSVVMKSGDDDIYESDRWFLCVSRNPEWQQFVVRKLRPYRYKDNRKWCYGWVDEHGNIYSHAVSPAFVYDKERVVMFKECL